MSHSTLLRTLTSGEHNVTDHPVKNMRTENTPRKVPFKDATNQASMFKTPCRGLKNEIAKNKEIQAPKLSTETLQDFSCDFHPSIHGGCFCNGNNKKSDIEMIMERRITPEFFELLMMDPLNSTDIYSDNDYDSEEKPELKRMPSPIYTPRKEIDFKFPEPEFDEDFNLITKITNDSGFSHGINDTVEESNDEIIIPDFDFDFSLDDLIISEDVCDDSFIKQW